MLRRLAHAVALVPLTAAIGTFAGAASADPLSQIAEDLEHEVELAEARAETAELALERAKKDEPSEEKPDLSKLAQKFSVDREARDWFAAQDKTQSQWQWLCEGRGAACSVDWAVSYPEAYSDSEADRSSLQLALKQARAGLDLGKKLTEKHEKGEPTAPLETGELQSIKYAVAYCFDGPQGLADGKKVAAFLEECDKDLKNAEKDFALHAQWVAIEAKEEALADRKRELASAQEERRKFKSALAETMTTAVSQSFTHRTAGIRRIRCLTAFCWGGSDGTKFAVEPILDMPVSMYWAAGESGLARHINATGLQLTIHAGVRFWFAYDKLSLGLILAEPELTKTARFGIDTSDKMFGPEAIYRPWPTLSLGILADVVSVSVSYDQLRNTDGTSAVDPQFRQNQVLSRTVTMGVSINTFTAMRNAFGLSRDKEEDK